MGMGLQEGIIFGLDELNTLLENDPGVSDLQLDVEEWILAHTVESPIPSENGLTRFPKSRQEETGRDASHGGHIDKRN